MTSIDRPTSLECEPSFTLIGATHTVLVDISWTVIRREKLKVSNSAGLGFAVNRTGEHPVNVAILGATGAVGMELLGILQERRFPIGELRLFASPRSVGESIPFAGRALTVQAIRSDRFQNVDLALFSAGRSAAVHWAPIAVKSGATVIDNSSAFRMDTNVPLVIPEINADDLDRHQGIVANPNCSTIIMLMAVAPIHRRFPVTRIVVSTYQAASGAGRQAMDELRDQTCRHLEGEPIQPRAFPHPLAFNLFSHESAVRGDGYNAEEAKMVEEARKILNQPRMAIAPTCVRVPVIRAHSESINLEFHRPVTPDQIRETLVAAPGVKVVDDRQRGRFPMPIDAEGRDEVLVGRIRSDASRPDGRGIEMLVCGDQLRKGAALNAVQIAEHLFGRVAGR